MESYTQPALIAASAILSPGSGADLCLLSPSCSSAPFASLVSSVSYTSSASSASSASFASFSPLHVPLSANHFDSRHFGGNASRFLTTAESQQENKPKQAQLIENTRPVSSRIATNCDCFGRPASPFRLPNFSPRLNADWSLSRGRRSLGEPMVPGE
jgi:hypothetical protein